MIAFEDFKPTDECVNEMSMGEICVHCNRCGRFNEIKKSLDSD